MSKKFDPKPLKLSTSKHETFEVGLDYDTNPEKTYPVFLFVPDRKQFTHWHLPLTRQQARRLRDWLNRYLGDK